MKPELPKSGRTILLGLLMPGLTHVGIPIVASTTQTTYMAMTPNPEPSCWKGSIKENQARFRYVE